MKLCFAPMTAADWPDVRRLYQEGIATGQATFESSPPATWDDFINSKIASCCLVARAVSVPPAPETCHLLGDKPAKSAKGAGKDLCHPIGDKLLGAIVAWTTLNPASARRVYAGVAEASVYVAAAARGQGVGSAVIAELIRVSEAHGIWTLQGVTFPENSASLALQRKHGFRVVGRREHIARLTHGPHAGQWCDTVLLERRSTTVGAD